MDKYEKLKNDLITALEIGRKAEEKIDDKGTCNFDSMMLSLDKWNTESVKNAAIKAGTVAYRSYVLGKKYWIFIPNTKGMADKRSANAEAMYKAMLSMGYDAYMYYQMD